MAFPEALKRSSPAAPAWSSTSGPKREDARNARLREVLEARDRLLPRGPDCSRSPASPRSPTSATAASPTRPSRSTSWAGRPAAGTRSSASSRAKRQVDPRPSCSRSASRARASAAAASYDRFRERVIFPIRDAERPSRRPRRPDPGQGGDAAEDGIDHGPKYLNSPATPLFDKSRTLYLIDRAKTAIRKTGQAVIVEGYTDALMAHQAGFDNVVASLGTALTPQQVALLTRYAKRIALAYDVDAAGQKAGTFGATALEELIRQLAPDDTGVELDDVRVVPPPRGQGPRRGRAREPDGGARRSGSRGPSSTT